MALTKTRTRTQTALTRLAKLLANLNGELEFVERLKREQPGFCDALKVRQTKLAEDRAAVCATVRQFDPELSLTEIGTSDQWMRRYGSRNPKAMVQQYVRVLSAPSQESAR